ncbi:hypothetical protein ACIQNU_43350 [Streptomyces sp. NPDC091292]|uniref:hypothetical protein n=1 Tax=Streptomyces sp. NPDC091292 TaxID=3365991 RepID=UPI00382F966D
MTDPHAYWSEITAEGPIYGRDHVGRAILGRFDSPFIKAALDWTAARALRIADALDPEPGVAWCPVGALRTVSDAVIAEGDVPTRLREWADSDTDRRDAYRQLQGGDPWALIVADHSGLYSFTIWPVSARASPSPSAPARRGRHRKHIPELVQAAP